MSGTLTPPASGPSLASVPTNRHAWRPRDDGPLSLPSRPGEPTWEIAERAYPRQGSWSEGEYLRLSRLSDRRVEFVDGALDFHGTVSRPSAVGEPTWEVAEFCFPRQGTWTEGEYLAVRPAVEGRVEFIHGTLDFHEMVDWAHGLLCRWLFLWLHESAAASGGGEVQFAPVTVESGEIDREPDLFVLRPGVRRAGRRSPDADDLLAAFEVVSRSRRSVTRDRVTKRAEYAAAGIPEYWIVDPRPDADPGDGGPPGPHIVVLTLSDGATPGAGTYAEHGTFRPGDTATSPALPGLACDVAALFAAAEG